MDVRCPASRHLLFSVSGEVELGDEIEIKCVCKRLVFVRDPHSPKLTSETRTRLRSESYSSEEIGYASTEFSSGLHRPATD